MTEIPEDVMAVVDGIGLELFGTPSFIFTSDLEYVARAIMEAKAEATAAERERAAKVAERHDTGDMMREDQEARRIAAAIRRGDI